VKKKQLIHVVDADKIGHTYDCIVDMRKYSNYHPMMTSVEIVGSENGTITFEVKENARLLGFIPLKPVYNATVTEVEKGKIIRYDSVVKKNVKLEIIFTFGNDGRVMEDITVWAGWPIGSIFMNLLQKMHVKVMHNMKNPSYKKQ
jgi:hypothetical protein